MRKVPNREKILSEGLALARQRGLGPSVREIVQAAGVPQGSFSNNFATKEDFGLEILERYHDMTNALVQRTLRNDALPPLRRLREWIDEQLFYLKKDGMEKGCLYGNFSVEAIEQSDAIRERVAAIFVENQKSVAYCLAAAVKAGELARSINVDEVAGVIVTSQQGAILVAKAQRSPEPVERFKRALFEHVLRSKA